MTDCLIVKTYIRLRAADILSNQHSEKEYGISEIFLPDFSSPTCRIHSTCIILCS